MRETGCRKKEKNLHLSSEILKGKKKKKVLEMSFNENLECPWF